MFFMSSLAIWSIMADIPGTRINNANLTNFYNNLESRNKRYRNDSNKRAGCPLIKLFDFLPGRLFETGA